MIRLSCEQTHRGRADHEGTEVHGFVGRAGQLRALSELLDECRGGAPQTAFVVGDAGSGKTTLLEHVIGLARRSGFRTVIVRGDGGDVPIPFGPLRVALAEIDDGQDPLVDEVRSMLVRRGEDGPGAPRHECADALRRLLEHWAARAPVLVAIDDLHLADAETATVAMSLVRSLARQRIALLLSARSDRLPIPLADDVRRAIARAGVRELELGGFNADELAELVRARTGSHPHDRNVRTLLTRTGGLPFFAVELVDAMQSAGIDLGAAADLAEVPLPRRTSTAILHRVFSLGHDARAVASACSIMTPIRLDLLPLLGDLTSLPADRTAGAFDLLAVAGILVETDDAYRFVHDLVRQALYDDLPPAVRRAWHADVADELSRRRSAGHPRQILEIAEHLRRGVGDRDEEAAALLREAGDTVLVEAPHEAIRWYRAALARVAPHSERVPDLQFCLSAALHLSGDQVESARIAASALRNLPPGPVRERGAAIAANAAFAMGSLDRAAALLDDALADPATRSSRLLLHRARVRLWQGHLGDARDDLDEGRIRGLGPLADVGDAVHMHLCFQRGDGAQGIEMAARLRRRLEDMRPTAQLDVRLALRTVVAFNLVPADAVEDEPVTDAGGVMAVWHQAISAVARLRQGQLRDALDRADRADDGAAGQPAGALRSLTFAVQVRALTELGDLVRADAVRHRAEDGWGVLALPALCECAIARLESVRGEHDAATARLQRAADDLGSSGRINLQAAAMAELVECAVAAGRPDVARTANARLRSLPLDERMLASNVHRSLAQAMAEGDEGAATIARQVASVNGLDLDAARALAILGDVRGSVELLRRAHDELGACGAVIRQQQVNALLRQHGSHSPTGRRRHGRTLTASESQIAQLVAEGLANRAIAERMHLSPKTVEVYLSRVFALTGCRSRVQLAVAVQRGDLAVAGSS